MLDQNKLFEGIAKTLSIKTELVNQNSHIVDDLGADSLDLVSLVMWLEETYNIEVSDEESENLNTVQDVIDFLNVKLK